MSVTTVTATQMVKDTQTADLKIAGGTAINASNTMQVAWPQDGKLLLVINNTYAGAKIATIESGDYLAAGQGDLACSIAQDAVVYLMLSSDRFKDSGYVNISFESGMTGYVRAISLP